MTDQQAQNALDVVNQMAASSPIEAPYNPYLVQQTVEVARGLLHRGVITMLIITVVPLVVAALACFLIPRRSQPAP